MILLIYFIAHVNSNRYVHIRINAVFTMVDSVLFFRRQDQAYLTPKHRIYLPSTLIHTTPIYLPFEWWNFRMEINWYHTTWSPIRWVDCTQSDNWVNPSTYEMQYQWVFLIKGTLSKNIFDSLNEYLLLFCNLIYSLH